MATKKLWIAAVFGLSTLAAPVAQANVDTVLKNICSIVESDDKSRFRHKLKMVRQDYSLKFRDVYEGISCSGKSLLRTALDNDSVETAKLMIKRLPKGLLAKIEGDGKSLYTWATESGKADSPILIALNERL